MLQRGLGQQKKAQEGVTLTTLLLIVLGVVVVVVIILGVTGVLGPIFDRGEDILPEQLEAVAQSCKIAAQANLIADYCYSFRDLNGDFVNCQDSRVQASLGDTDTSGVESACDDSIVSDSIMDVCLDVGASDRGNVEVNGITCANHGYGETFEGETSGTCESLAGDGEQTVWLEVDEEHATTPALISHCVSNEDDGLSGSVGTVTDQAELDQYVTNKGDQAGVCCVIPAA